VAGGDIASVGGGLVSALGALAESVPCKSRCPQCGGRCINAEGHLSAETCGRKVLPEIHCCLKHCWGSLTDLHSMLRANNRETRRELEEELGKRLKSARQLRYENGG
jgi:hypothetical protein